MKLPSTTPGRPGLQFALIGGLILLSTIAITRLVIGFLKPAPAVPSPLQVEKLDPQLRDYLEEKVQWARERPRSAERQATLGLAYAANAMWAEARLSFSNVVRLTPKEPLARLYFAVATQECGDRTGAVRLLEELAAANPDFGPGLYRLGDVALQAGMLEPSAEAFQRLIALQPGEWRGYAGLGEVKLRQGQNLEAAQLLEKAVALEPDAKSAHNLLGLAYRGLGRMEEAKLELSLGLDHATYPMPDEWAKLVPQHMRLLQDQLDIANEMAADGRAVDAVLLLEKALAYHPENLGLLNNLAIALNRAGEPKKARAVVQRALKLNDHYLPGWITLSYSSQALGQNEAALNAADRAITLAPTTAQPHLAKANVLLGMERDQEALAELEAAFRCDPKNAEIQVELGDVCWRNLHLADEALNHYRSATNLNPTLLLAYLRLAEFNLDRGETNSAREIIQTAARVAPKNPDLVQLRERAGGAQEGK